ncbi:MAG: hypothetical protein KDA41_14140 [Planctomycetales bacterium]|nr:hypothetical protein [Planctomycetales bacterium]
MTTTLHDDAVRKAALLISALDTAGADALLDGMDPAFAARVRSAMMTLDAVDDSEQQHVIEEFLGRRAPVSDERGEDELQISDLIGAPSDEAAAAPVSFAAYAEQRSQASAHAADVNAINVAATDDEEEPHPFHFLATAAPEDITEALRHEHPQAAAVVLAHMNPALAARVLAQFSPTLQADVSSRIVALAHVDEATLSELQLGLRELVDTGRLAAQGSQTGMSAMRGILAASGGQERERMLGNLRQRNVRLPKLPDAAVDAARPEASVSADATPSRLAFVPAHSGPAVPATPHIAMEFEDLLELSDADLGRVLRQADGRMLLLALAGASERLMARVYGQLPRREAEMFRRQIEQQGPISLRDVDEAQRRMAALAGALAAEGVVDWRPKRFAMAA